jgi:hypothetical protein
MKAAEDIICLAKDWHEPKTSNNHVMEELAKRHRVLWVNSVATRNPNLGSANDLAKIVRKFGSWLRGAETVHDNLRVLTPIVLPFPRSRAARAVNRLLLGWLVRRAAREWGFQSPQLWIFPPNAVDYIGQFGESRLVYYCVDEWSEFTHLDASFIRRKEAELLKAADVVFAVSENLRKSKSALNKNTHLIPHGVNHNLFAQALRGDFEVAEPLRGLRRPVIGFYGTIYDWIDQDLLAGIARLRPAWSIVLVGKVMTDVARLRACANIQLMESQPYDQLPRFCKGFDVGIVPYDLRDPRMQSVNPLKLREFLAAGMCVVSVDLPEVRKMEQGVLVATGVEDFVVQIEHALGLNAAAQKKQRSDTMKSESWTARVARIEEILAGGIEPDMAAGLR